MARPASKSGATRGDARKTASTSPRGKPKAQMGLPFPRRKSFDGIVCGVDEAGRGPLAGPVYAAAVVLDPARPIRGLRDSKQLTPARREALALKIRERARAWSIAWASVDEIDSLNIYHASLLAMRRAVEGLSIVPTLARIDGKGSPAGLPCPVETVIGGDATDVAIAAASILAKTARDEAMMALHLQFPAYGFDAHKGYATDTHLKSLQLHGACVAHRRSFAPVRIALFGAEPNDLPGLQALLGDDALADDDAAEYVDAFATRSHADPNAAP